MIRLCFSIDEAGNNKLIKPSDLATIWTNNKQNTSERSNFIGSIPYEKSIESFLFRSNFPVRTHFQQTKITFFIETKIVKIQEHFLSIRLLKLNIEDVQQLVRQIDLLENVQDKLAEMVHQESLSGPALMSCDLSELKKVSFQNNFFLENGRN